MSDASVSIEVNAASSSAAVRPSSVRTVSCFRSAIIISTLDNWPSPFLSMILKHSTTRGSTPANGSVEATVTAFVASAPEVTMAALTGGASAVGGVGVDAPQPMWPCLQRLQQIGPIQDGAVAFVRFQHGARAHPSSGPESGPRRRPRPLSGRRRQ